MSPTAAQTLTPQKLGAMLLLAMMWGLSIPVTKVGLETIPPLTLTAMRFLVAVPLLFVMSARRLWLPAKAVPHIVGLGVMGILLGNVAQSFGVKGTSASVATILSATIPLFVVVFAALRLKQPVTRRQWLGLLAAFAGIALVALEGRPGSGGMGQNSFSGVVWMLVSAIAIAAYYIWSAVLTERYGTLPVVTWNSLVGLLVMLPISGWELSRTPVAFSQESILATIYLGVMVSVAGLLLWLYLLRVLPARVAASVQYLQPIIGIGVSAIVFGDALGPAFVAGVVFILGGLALAAAGKRTERQLAAEHASP